MADLSTIEPVEVFAVGVHPTDDGPREYSDADLDQIVANFARLSDPEKSARVILEPTIVLGHEEDGDENKFWADLSTGVPSVGVVTKLWREGPKLLAQFSDVIPEVQDAIRKKMYRKVSSEIYDNFEDQGQGYGLAIRRVALLGGEIPQVKQLSDILAHVKMSERKGKITRVTFFSEKFCEGCGGTCGQKDKQQNFQEAESMDRSQMLEALQAMGVDTSVIDDQTPDAVLEAWLKSVGGGEESQEPPAEGEYAEDPMVDPNDPNAQETQDQMFADDPTIDPVMDPSAGPPPVVPAPEEEKKVAQMSCQKKFSEAADRYVRHRVDQEFKRKELQSQRKETIRQFCERLKTQGKVVPAMLDGSDGKPTLETVLGIMAASPVQKFGEKKVDPLKLAMEFFEGLPQIAKFSEYIANPKKEQVAAERTNELLAHSRVGRLMLADQKK